MTTLTNTAVTAGTLTSLDALSAGTLSDDRTDMLLRMTKSSVEDVYSIIASIPTAHVQSELSGVLQCIRKANDDVKVLQDVVKWQHHLLDYNAHYNAFLLEQVTESEFEEVAATFAYEQQEVEIPALQARVERILTLTNIDYPPSDLAEFFHCDPSQVVQVYQSLVPRFPNIASMVPVTDLPDSR